MFPVHVVLPFDVHCLTGSSLPFQAYGTPGWLPFSLAATRMGSEEASEMTSTEASFPNSGHSKKLLQKLDTYRNRGG